MPRHIIIVMNLWPNSEEELISLQNKIAGEHAVPFVYSGEDILVGGVYVCFKRGGHGVGSAMDEGWAGVALFRGHKVVKTAVVRGYSQGPYCPGLLAIREGKMMDDAVRTLGALPDVLMVNATGIDHPRGCGLAVHLGHALGIPTIGVTLRPLVATGALPENKAGAQSLLYYNGKVVALYLRVKKDVRPLVVHAGFRTDLDSAVRLVLAYTKRALTPEPIRVARQVARETRSKEQQD